MKIVKTYSSEGCNTYDVINENNVVIAYYYEHFSHPETNEKLSTSVFEIYYDFDEEYNEFSTSQLFESMREFNDFLLTLQ
jgi:hypothetical protein